MKKTLSLLLAMFAIYPLSAAIFLPIETTQLQRVVLSSNHQNRILVEGDRILKTIYPDDGSVSVTIEEESGQVFVHSMVSNPPTLTISIITSSGLVQDLEVSFAIRSSALVVLSLPVAETSSSENECWLPSDRCWVELSTPEVIQEKVNSILSGRVPLGYVSCSHKGPVRMIKKCIRGENIGRLRSSSEDLYLWRIENTSSSQSLKIWECELSFEGSSWIYIEKNCLNPGEVVTAIVAVEKNGK